MDSGGRQIFGFDNFLDIEYYISAFEANYNPGFYFPGEYHDFWEVVYVISSKVGVSSDEKVFDLYEGDVIFHKPMEFHRLWTIDDSNAHLFIMSFKLSGNLGEKLNDKVIHLSEHQRELMHSLISEFAKSAGFEFEENIPVKHPGIRKISNFLRSWDKCSASTLSVKYKTLLFLVDILQSDFPQKEQKSSKSARVYREIVEIMEKNVHGKITVEEIAKKCNFSVAYIKKVFAMYSDCGIHKYFQKLKIKEAVALLETGISVSDVSERLAFANANYFGICFKKEMGCSPTSYLKKESGDVRKVIKRHI